MRQKDDSKTDGEGIQNSDQASNAIRSRNVGYNEEINKKLIENATMDVTCKDKIRNEHIRGTTRVTQALTNLLINLKDKILDTAIGTLPNFARMCG